jgi:hypothetical protein
MQEAALAAHKLEAVAEQTQAAAQDLATDKMDHLEDQAAQVLSL